MTFAARTLGYASSVIYTGTLTIGRSFSAGVEDLRGYNSGVFGSLSPTAINTYTILAVFDYYDLVSFNTSAEVWISGGSPPPQSLFDNVTVNGVTLSSSSAFFTTAGGTSYWTWGGLFGLGTSGTTSCVFSS